MKCEVFLWYLHQLCAPNTSIPQQRPHSSHTPMPYSPANILWIKLIFWLLLTDSSGCPTIDSEVGWGRALVYWEYFHIIICEINWESWERESTLKMQTEQVSGTATAGDFKVRCYCTNPRRWWDSIWVLGFGCWLVFICSYLHSLKWLISCIFWLCIGVWLCGISLWLCGILIFAITVVYCIFIHGWLYFLT